MTRSAFGRFLAMCAMLVFALPVASLGGDAVYSEDFSRANATGLPNGWTTGPRAHVPFFGTARDSTGFGAQAPSIRVDTPLLTLNYRLASPYIYLPAMDRDYTLEFALQLDQPDSPFRVEIVYMDLETNWHHAEVLMSLVGETMDSLRVFRIPFNPQIGPQPGRCWITFGLSYSKVLRGGYFRLDDFRIVEGRGAGNLAFYLTPESVAPGEPVDVHISSSSGRATVEVWREDEFPILVYGPAPIEGLREEPIPNEAWRNGCDWPVSMQIPTGFDWRSAVYTVKIDDGDQSDWDTFVVRGNGSEGKLLVILPTNTDQAYNGWGGGSFYSDPQRPEISFERPDDHPYWGVYQNPIHLIRWLHRNGIAYAMADDSDLHYHPELLLSYPGVVLTWHSEYWTREMRWNLEQYIDAGGSVLSLSGNTCWWQARLVEPNDPVEPGASRRLICYKYTAESDPYHDIDSSRVTTHWDEPPINDPPTRLLGLSWRTGGGINFSTSSTCPCEYDWLEGHGGYEAFRTDHWVYEGTGVKEGDTIGQAYAILGHEVDGTQIEWVDGKPVPLPTSGTPSGFEILGYAPCWNDYSADAKGEALMAIQDRGRSFIFNGGTTGWCWGLANDPVIQQITHNLVRRVPAFLEEPVRLSMEAFPNPSGHGVSLRLLGPTVPDVIRFYDVGGRLVGEADVEGTQADAPIGFGRAFWDFRDRDGRELPTGVYLARASDDEVVRVVRIR